MKTIVVGGGASGLIAALKARENSEVIILEKNDKLGKKLLLTGNGHCNYWNKEIDITKYESDSLETLKSIINEDNINEVYKYLYSLGIYPREKDGYIYPYSNQAYSFREVLEQNILKKGIKVIYNAKVTDVRKENDKFIITYNDTETITGDKLIISAGSVAYSKTGSTGDLYPILENLGHKLNPLYPALTSLKCDADFTKIWSGIRTDAKVSIYVNDKLKKEEVGEVQLTDYGISGVCVFNLSSIASSHIGENVKVVVNFLPNITDFEDFLYQRSRDLPDATMEEMFESIFSYKLNDIFFHNTHINSKAYYKSLTTSEINKLKEVMTHLELNITGTGDFEKAQVCKGGISLMDINPLSMESKKVSNLFITGEILDVNGICGGYNLSFAFITGYIAGEYHA